MQLCQMAERLQVMNHPRQILVFERMVWLISLIARPTRDSHGIIKVSLAADPIPQPFRTQDSNPVRASQLINRSDCFTSAACMIYHNAQPYADDGDHNQ